LSHSDATARLERDGPNKLAEAERVPGWKRFLGQFNNVLNYVLMGAAVMSAAVGDLKDPIVILIVLLINAIAGFIQENKADEAMEALGSMLETIVTVRRDSRPAEVPASELVVGDIVLLEAGDMVPADGRILLARNLAVDEATFTGESLPVEKNSATLPDGDGERAVNDQLNCLFMNTTVVRGRAELLVTGTGMDTEVGNIAGLMNAVPDDATPLQKQLDELGKRLAVIAVVAVLAVFVLALAQGEDFADAALEAVALAVAAIPEGLPAVVTVTLALGVARMAEQHAIVKRLASVETLGSTTDICSDKTGTLTLNQMTVTRFVSRGTRWEAEGLGYERNGSVSDANGESGDFTIEGNPALLMATVCNDAHLGTDPDGRAQIVGDPTEAALLVVAEKAGLDTHEVRQRYPRVAEVPFESERKFMATLHEHPADDHRSIVVVKGAPDVVLARADSVATATGESALSDDLKAELLEHNHEMGSAGLRVLAVASRSIPVRAGEYEGDLLDDIGSLRIEALMGILDPARPEAIQAVGDCRSAGIRVRMITGDHPSTAAAIASELGIDGDVVTGAELDEMSDSELDERIGQIGVCARVAPQHKVRVVESLRSQGGIVAMTGDGVNDAPALKTADIGVAMGITGTEVTKEAGDMILTDDNFATIVAAVERGRAIYDNILTFVRFQLTTNVAAISTILMARILGMPTPFNPIQVLFVNIIADGPPAISLGMDPPRPDLMDRQPRSATETILNRPRLVRIVYAGVVMTAVTLGVLAIADDRVESGVALTMTFTTFVLLQLSNALSVRAGGHTIFSRHTFTNRALWLSLGGVLLVQVLVVELPFLQKVFTTESLTGAQWLICLAFPMAFLLAEEARRWILRTVIRKPVSEPV
jgi:Ca2+-transporting ATPase